MTISCGFTRHLQRLVAPQAVAWELGAKRLSACRARLTPKPADPHRKKQAF
jgi:hypothetical protein